MLCAGLLYGGDGGLFHSLQRDAWMCDAPIACVSAAANRVLALHVTDAVNLVCASAKNERKYETRNVN